MFLIASVMTLVAASGFLFVGQSDDETDAEEGEGGAESSEDASRSADLDVTPLDEFLGDETQDQPVLGSIGADTMEGGMGDDLLNGLDGADQINGQEGADTVLGGAGQDMIHGAEGDDSLMGGADADVLHGEDGDDWLSGGSGDDQIFGHFGNDAIDGGTGDDSVHAGQGNDYLDGQDGDDALHGNDGEDTLVGGLGADTLFGGYDADLILGDDDGLQDYLNGGAGADTLFAGTNDIVTGGSDADQLVVSDAEDSDGIQIMDFEPGVDELVIPWDFDPLDPPIVAIQPALDAPDQTEVRVDDHLVATLAAGTRIDMADIILQSTTAGTPLAQI